jgi:hypothetical protein
MQAAKYMCVCVREKECVFELWRREKIILILMRFLKKEIKKEIYL